MKNFGAITQKYDNPSFKITCNACGLNNYTWQSQREMEASGAAILNQSPLIMTCPSCSMNLPGNIEQPHQLSSKLLDSAVHIILSSNNELDADATAIQVGACPNCEDSIYTQDKRKDSQHPLVGYEYYLCSSCDTALRLNQV
jgi:ribosomal protein L33